MRVITLCLTTSSNGEIIASQRIHNVAELLLLVVCCREEGTGIVMAIRSRRQTVAGDAPLCLKAQRSQGNSSHMWQYYKQSRLQDVLPGPGGDRSLVFARSPGLG